MGLSLMSNVAHLMWAPRLGSLKKIGALNDLQIIWLLCHALLLSQLPFCVLFTCLSFKQIYIPYERRTYVCFSTWVNFRKNFSTENFSQSAKSHSFVFRWIIFNYIFRMPQTDSKKNYEESTLALLLMTICIEP